jgi:predicted dehydrogenase
MKNVKIAVVGVGGMGFGHLNSLKEIKRAELCAVCDIRKEVADKVASVYGVPAYYDASEMYDRSKPDAVIIATPHYDHTPLAISALQKGIHVLTEKPVAVHKADAQKMIDAHAKRPELVFSAMFQCRTDHYYRKLKDLIQSGELGKIRRVVWIITNWFRSQTYYNSGGWRATWRGEGGGVLLNQCPHNLDLFQWFFGMPERVRAFCSFGKYHDIEVEDDVTAYMEMPGGGTGVFIASTGEAPGTNRLEINCERGKVVLENGKIIFNRTEVPVGEFCATTDKSFDSPPMWNVEVGYPQGGGRHSLIIQNFVDAILDGTPLVAPAEEGINSVELANSMILSALKNKTVEMPMDAGEFEAELKKLIKNSKFVKAEGKSTSEDIASSFTKK